MTPPHAAVRKILSRGQTSARGRNCEQMIEVSPFIVMRHKTTAMQMLMLQGIGTCTHPVYDLVRTEGHDVGIYRFLASFQPSGSSYHTLES